MKHDACVKNRMVTDIPTQINGLNFMGKENEGLRIQALHLPGLASLLNQQWFQSV